MLVTDGGTLIRCPIDDIRIAGRNTQGVTIFKTEDDARVVSVAHLADASDDSDDDDEAADAETDAETAATAADDAPQGEADGGEES